MCSNETETNDVNGFRLSDPRPASVLDRGTLVVIMQILPLIRE